MFGELFCATPLQLHRCHSRAACCPSERRQIPQVPLRALLGPRCPHFSVHSWKSGAFVRICLPLRGLCVLLCLRWVQNTKGKGLNSSCRCWTIRKIPTDRHFLFWSCLRKRNIKSLYKEPQLESVPVPRVCLFSSNETFAPGLSLPLTGLLRGAGGQVNPCNYRRKKRGAHHCASYQSHWAGSYNSFPSSQEPGYRADGPDKGVAMTTVSRAHWELITCNREKDSSNFFCFIDLSLAITPRRKPDKKFLTDWHFTPSFEF